jgi:hypothetical protein
MPKIGLQAISDAGEPDEACNKVEAPPTVDPRRSPGGIRADSNSAPLTRRNDAHSASLKLPRLWRPGLRRRHRLKKTTGSFSSAVRLC